MSNLVAPPPIWCLVDHADGQHVFVPIDGSPLIVGRSANVGLRIAKPTISSQHAVLTIKQNRLRIRDLRSTNGTFVNGVPVEGESALDSGDLVQFAEEVFQVGITEARIAPVTLAAASLDAAVAAIQFNKLIDECAVVPFFQPIVEVANERPIGYEVLGRSRLASLPTPDIMFKTASKFSMEADLSRLFRREGMRVSSELPGPTTVYLNTHPVELVDLTTLRKSLEELRKQVPTAKIVLEIHEAAVTNTSSVLELRDFLRDLEMGLAYDDFGSGQARLHELVEATPDILKFDISLIRDIHKASQRKQKMLEQLVRITLDLGVTPLAEGVESRLDHEACLQLGFTLGQGFYYGKPGQARSFHGNPNDTEKQ
ncbi:MAG TPA: EAL domain-containing protein [Pirellulaceae bacterium]|nr:EAL domain-containing protein [Pirellulaceae bacterium]